MYHVIANSSLVFSDKDHARLEAYWMTVSAAGGNHAVTTATLLPVRGIILLESYHGNDTPFDQGTDRSAKELAGCPRLGAWH
jgi:hypothetical protein